MRIAREQPPLKVRKSRENPALSDFHDFFVGLIFRKCYFETARFYCLALYASPHAHMESRMGFRLLPSSVREYSTLGGTSA